METIGLVGLGKIGLPIAENLIKSGYRVLGYRRTHGGFRAGRRRAGGLARRHWRGSRHRVHLPALGGGARRGRPGPAWPRSTARPGQIVVEFGSHLVPDKERQIAPLAAKGAMFIDGEVGGTPGMVAAQKAVVYLTGDKEAARKAEAVAGGFADIVHYFGPFGAASKVKLINNMLVTVHMAAAAQAMAIGLKAGVDVDLMIKAATGGSGGSTQFGIRAPWMAQRRFLPAQGAALGLSHYFDLIGDFADRAGVATPMLDRAADFFMTASTRGSASATTPSWSSDRRHAAPQAGEGQHTRRRRPRSQQRRKRAAAKKAKSKAKKKSKTKTARKKRPSQREGEKHDRRPQNRPRQLRDARS